MRKLLVVPMLLLVCGVYTAGQDAPKAELFGGYSYLHFDKGNAAGGDNSVPGGFNIDGTYYFLRLIGGTADFQFHHKSWSNDPVFGSADGNVFSFHAGPRLKAHLGKFEPFVHALFGVTHGSFAPEGGTTHSDNAFSMKLGGGLDVAVHRHIALRLGEANYYYTNFSKTANFNTNGQDHQSNFTFSVGVVLR